MAYNKLESFLFNVNSDTATHNITIKIPAGLAGNCSAID